jgi:hypothetical protein
LLRIVCFFLGATSLVLPAYATQSESLPPKFSEAAQHAAQIREKKIQRELAKLQGHPWAGEYYYGDGLGVNVSLTIAPENGFVFRWHGCLGLYDLNYGKLDVSDGRIQLLFTYANIQEGFQGIAADLIPVQWGNRHYLIPSDGFVKFANAVNAGTEPNDPMGGRSYQFLLRRGDEKKDVSGQPPIPEEYAAYLLKRPIAAKVISVGESHLTDSSRFTHVTLNVGVIDGLKKGMELYVHGPQEGFGTATVVSVEERTSQAILDQFSDTQVPLPSVGLTLSTKLSD